MFSGSGLKDTAFASIHQQTYGSGLSNQRRCREHRSSGKADPDLNTHECQTVGAPSQGATLNHGTKSHRPTVVP